MMENNECRELNRNKITMSDVQMDSLRSQFTIFQQQLRKTKQQFQTSHDQIYFLLSTKFISQWKSFCLSDQLEKYQLPMFNIDLIDINKKQLIAELRENVDFQIINTNAMKILANNNRGISLMRRASKVGLDKKVQIYLENFNYITITQIDIRHIDNRVIDLNKFKNKLKKIQESSQSTIQQFLKGVKLLENYSGKQLRAWRIGKDIDLQYIYSDIAEKTKHLRTHQMAIKGIGKRINDVTTKLSDLNLQDGEFFLLEAKQMGRDFFLIADTDGKCQNCNKMKQLKCGCLCKKVAYCSQQCKEKDKNYHMNHCSQAQQQQLNERIEMKITEYSRKGLVGLSNLGNTCFMNSCLQCLSNTMPLTEYFLQSRYVTEINRSNPLGSKGKLAKCYAKFIRAMWCYSQSTFSPYNLKDAVSRIAPMFSGYAQHDSQQFFSFIVDGLHEDLNRIKKKPYIQAVESDGKEDNEVALKSWLNHVRRNQSVIVDLMTGQYKSKVKCPDCHKQSITFDPFITVTLPIFQENNNLIEPYVIFRNIEKDTKKISIRYTKPNIQQWLTKASIILSIEPKRLKFYLLSKDEGINEITSDNIKHTLSKIEQQNKDLFIIQLSQDESTNQCIPITVRFSKKALYTTQHQSLWFKFPFYFQQHELIYKEMVKKLLKFLYLETYNYSIRKSSSTFMTKKYQNYQEIMLNEKPFSLFMRYRLSPRRSYSKQYIYAEQVEINEQTNVIEMIKQFGKENYQLDVRFHKQKLKQFTVQNLKTYKDSTDKLKRNNYGQDTSINLYQCFQVLQQPQQLQPGNQWYCPQCKQHKLATKQLTIYKAPKILILHLKRFKQKGCYKRQKNQSLVNFPMILDLSNYLIDKTPIDTYRQQAIKEGVYIKPTYQLPPSQSINALYQLYAVSNHYGGLGGGHYTAFAKNQNGKWYEFNDSQVRNISESNVCSTGAYILFYKRKQ